MTRFDKNVLVVALTALLLMGYFFGRQIMFFAFELPIAIVSYFIETPLPKTNEGLYKRLEDSRDNVRYHAADVLVSKGREAVPYFIRGLNHPYDHVKEVSAYGLGKIGPLAKDSLPMLIKLSSLEANSQEEIKKAISLIQNNDGAPDYDHFYQEGLHALSHNDFVSAEKNFRFSVVFNPRNKKARDALKQVQKKMSAGEQPSQPAIQPTRP